MKIYNNFLKKAETYQSFLQEWRKCGRKGRSRALSYWLPLHTLFYGLSKKPINMYFFIMFIFTFMDTFAHSPVL